MPEEAERAITEAENKVLAFLECPNPDPELERYRQEVRLIAEDEGLSSIELADLVLEDLVPDLPDELVREGAALLDRLATHDRASLETMVGVLRFVAPKLERQPPPPSVGHKRSLPRRRSR